MFLRFDSEGQALDGVSISDLKGGGSAGSNTNWKTLYEVKSENLGHGDKVPCVPDFLHKSTCSVQRDAFSNLISGTSCQTLMWLGLRPERDLMVGNRCQGAVALLPQGIDCIPQALETGNVKNSDLDSRLILRGI